MKSKGKNPHIVLFANEDELRNALIKALEKNGIRPSVEIPFLGRSLDIIYRRADGSITAIEVKRLSKHIRSALNQAKICLLGADRVYVCMMRYDVTKEIKSVFRDLGVGLIFIGPKGSEYSVQYVLPAGRNTRKRKEYAAMLREAMSRK